VSQAAKRKEPRLEERKTIMDGWFREYTDSYGRREKRQGQL
jgi:hypothetical protein